MVCAAWKMATMARWCAVDRYVVVERGDIHVKGLVGIVIEDKRDKKKGKGKGQVLVKYSAQLPGSARKEGQKQGWYYQSTLIDGSAHEQAYKDAQKAGKLCRLVVEREESESDSSSDGSSVSCPAPAPAPAAPRRSGRANIGQVLEAFNRCDQCDACLSTKRPPPGCKCGVCEGKYFGTCREVKKARENPPDCVQWGRRRSPLPEIGAGEQGSARRGDPLSAEDAKLTCANYLSPAGTRRRGRRRRRRSTPPGRPYGE